MAWWLGWVAWVAAWGSITYFKPASDELKTLITLGSIDLDTILRLVLYFILTRADSFQVKDALLRGVFLAFILTVGYGILHLTFSSPLAYHLHEQWSMCLGVVSPILVGWAIRLRFRSYFALVIGFAYGFAQPAAFEAVLHGKDHPGDSNALANALILLALMKVVWASVVTRYFFGDPDSAENLVQTPVFHHEVRFFGDAPKPFYLLPLGLVVGALCFYLILRPVGLSTFAMILGIVAALVAIVKNGLDLWDRYQKWRLTKKGDLQENRA